MPPTMMSLNACEVKVDSIMVFHNTLANFVPIYMFMIETEYFVLATCIINSDCEADKFCEIFTGECKWREGEGGKIILFYIAFWIAGEN